MIKTDLLIYVIFALIICAFAYAYFFKDNDFELKCIVSGVDGNKYCVRDRTKVQEAADLLARVANKCRDLVEYAKEKYAEEECVKRLAKKFNPQKFAETLPTSQYTAYSENKGEKLAFCLNKEKKGEDQMIDEHTLTFVAIHELSHIATESIGHESEFWQNFKFLLEVAKESGIHDPKDYKDTPTKYCGMQIKDNPFYDVK